MEETSNMAKKQMATANFMIASSKVQNDAHHAGFPFIFNFLHDMKNL